MGILGVVLPVALVVAAALVAWRRDLWRRPWLVVLLTLVAYGAGLILALNVWMWLGLPH